MAQIRYLDRAPIDEAVIELRVRSTSPIDLEPLAALSANWKLQYPLEQKVESVAATFGVQDGKAMTDAQYQELGFMLKAEDHQDVVQFRRDAFVYSRLSPYTSWEQVLPKAAELWASYRDAIKPERVVRLGVRYINRLRLPLPVDLSEYLTSPPVVPQTLPSTIRAYLTRMILHDASTSNSVAVTHASEPSMDQNRIVVLLDVDAFREVDMDPADEGLLEILESLRQLKNQVFFGSITERTAEMYA
jgi:uncharacterized protein (TIGR04255 family)